MQKVINIQISAAKFPTRCLKSRVVRNIYCGVSRSWTDDIAQRFTRPVTGWGGGGEGATSTTCPLLGVDIGWIYYVCGLWLSGSDMSVVCGCLGLTCLWSVIVSEYWRVSNVCDVAQLRPSTPMKRPTILKENRICWFVRSSVRQMLTYVVSCKKAV